MKKTLIAILVSLVVISCAQSKKVLPPPPAKAVSLLSQLHVDCPPAAMPDADRIALETACLRVVGSGPVMVSAILSDLETSRDANRRGVLIRLLAMIAGRLPSDPKEREPYDNTILAMSRRMLESKDSSDRYIGLQLTGLPARSLMVPTSIRVLEDDDTAMREFALATLQAATGLDFGFKANAPEDVRKAAVKRWKSWWSKNKDKEMYASHAPSADPVLAAFNSELDDISRLAGPYSLVITEKETKKPVEEAVVAYSYRFISFDNRDILKKEHAVTDNNGRLLMAAEKVAAGTRYTGADIIVSKAGYKQETITLFPHLLTPNSYTVEVALEAEAK